MITFFSFKHKHGDQRFDHQIITSINLLQQTHLDENRFVQGGATKRNLDMDQSAVWAGSGCMAVSPISGLCLVAPLCTQFSNSSWSYDEIVDKISSPYRCVTFFSPLARECNRLTRIRRRCWGGSRRCPPARCSCPPPTARCSGCTTCCTAPPRCSSLQIKQRLVSSYWRAITRPHKVGSRARRKWSIFASSIFDVRDSTHILNVSKRGGSSLENVTATWYTFTGKLPSLSPRFLLV